MNTDVKSPCRNICQLTPDRRFCAGCGRTPDEIARWLGAGSGEKREILGLAAQRLAGHFVNKD